MDNRDHQEGHQEAMDNSHLVGLRIPIRHRQGHLRWGAQTMPHIKPLLDSQGLQGNRKLVPRQRHRHLLEMMARCLLQAQGRMLSRVRCHILRQAKSASRPLVAPRHLRLQAMRLQGSRNPNHLLIILTVTLLMSLIQTHAFLWAVDPENLDRQVVQAVQGHLTAHWMTGVLLTL